MIIEHLFKTHPRSSIVQF